MRKPFDKQLFDDNDSAARHAITEYLVNNYEVMIEENPDQYGVDLFVRGRLYDYAVECEIKRVWSGSEFPWPTVQLPERKAKYIYQGLPVEYWILNSECTHAIIIPGGRLTPYLLKEVPNKYVSKGERFYQVPIEDCRRATLNE